MPFTLSLGLPSFKIAFHAFQELLGLGINAPGRLDQTDERIQPSSGVEIFGLPIREAAEAPKVPPISRATITAEFLSQRSRGCGTHLLAEPFRVLKPSLEIARRRFHNDCWIEASHRLGELVGSPVAGKESVSW